MTVSDGALREGLIYDLLGRFYNNDIRSDTVKTLAEHYHVDMFHATRIKQTIKFMLNQLDTSCGADKKAIVQFLDWAAMLHEIGHEIAHNQYHKHSAYIVENGDLAGFSRQDQILLATLIRAHRRKFPLKDFSRLPAPWNNDAPYIAIVLRIAVLLHRNRHDVELPDFKISIKPGQISLTFPTNWLSGAPLTQADLQQEANYLKSAGLTMELS
jgi:exopolyphosphatase/guanosine-5'-triphosphate,3'-diphosphate pyrophosphatase